MKTISKEIRPQNIESRISQQPLLQCPPLVKNVQYLKGQTAKLNDKLIYGSIDQQIVIVNIYSDILEAREKFTTQTQQ